MGLHTRTTIIISGKDDIHQFNSLSLYQEIGTHHHLEIAFRMDEFEKIFTTTNSLFGEKISIKIANAKDDEKELLFVGYITQIKKTKTDLSGSSDEIIIIANSPTIFADDGPNYRAFIDEKPSDIVKKVLGDYTNMSGENPIKCSVSSYPHTLPYSVQHNESTFDYVCRLAAQYGQWCYYDGSEKFVFGNPTDSTAIELNYPEELIEFNLSQLPQPSNFGFMAYDANVKSNSTAATTNKANNVLKSGILKDKSSVLFNQSSGGTEGLLQSVAQSQEEALAINQVRFTGVSTNPMLKLGSLIKPTGASEGTYRIIKISHSNNGFGSYENRFESVASKFNAYPYTNIRAYPVSQNQIGLVDQTHDDPDNLGRIKVRLFYHENSGAMWMRMLTPHAGDQRGIFFLPEVGDEVLVGFEGSNAEHPYVMGCLYNGEDKPPIEADELNTKKIIKTRSDLFIEFDDEKKKITIQTPAENTFILDEDNKSIEIKDQHENKITMDEQGIVIDSAKDIKMSAKGNIDISASGGGITIKATSDVKVDGADVALNAKTKFTAKGNASAEISASGQTTVKGAMVMIN